MVAGLEKCREWRLFAGAKKVVMEVAMPDTQLYFAIDVPVFAVIMGMTMNIIVLVWQARGVEKRINGLEKRIDGVERRLDKIDRRLEIIQSGLKQFYADMGRLKERTGL